MAVKTDKQIAIVDCTGLPLINPAFGATINKKTRPSLLDASSKVGVRFSVSGLAML